MPPPDEQCARGFWGRFAKNPKYAQGIDEPSLALKPRTTAIRGRQHRILITWTAG